MKSKKRHKLGEGFIWFGDHGPAGYTNVSLCVGPNGTLPRAILKVGPLGGWQKVKLYAEYIPAKPKR